MKKTEISKYPRFGKYQNNKTKNKGHFRCFFNGIQPLKELNKFQ